MLGCEAEELLGGGRAALQWKRPWFALNLQKSPQWKVWTHSDLHNKGLLSREKGFTRALSALGMACPQPQPPLHLETY